MGALAVVAAVVIAPWVLRGVDFFRVRQVELVGLRYLAPEQVLEALALARDRNLFDDNGEVARRASTLPGVVAVRIERRLPGVLRVVLVERTPVAFAPGPAGLVPLDGNAHPLPYDPTVTGFDLPVVERPDTVLTRTLSLVRTADSSLFRRVDAVSHGAGESVILELGQRRVLLQATSTVEEIRAVEAVRRHLERTGRPFVTLDARFAGWVVVRRGRV